MSECEELDKLKVDFLATTTHELKAPLIPIKSQAQMLLTGQYGDLNNEQKKSIEMIYQNEERLNRLTDELIDLTRMKSRKFVIVPRKADLSKILFESVGNLTDYAKEDQIKLAFEAEPRLPKVKVDELRIRQVMNNLLCNAIKFTKRDGKVVVSVRRKDGKVEVAVTDTGIGISKDNVEKLFVPFFQIDSCSERNYHGTGLGLAISKGIVEAHGGEIWVVSKGLNKGSKFIFTLPIRTK